MRLIDADVLKNELSDKDYITYTHEYGDAIPVDWIMSAIDNAPTVPLPDFKEGYKQAIIDGKTNFSRPSGWILVSERLPEDMQKVLVWFEYYRYGDYNCMYQTYGFGYVCDGEWSRFINGESGWQDARIIAWLPLPEPYKKGGAE